MANYNTSTNPGSPFTQRPILVRKDETSVRRLLGREFTVGVPGRPARQSVLTDDQVADALRRELGPALSAAEVTALVAALPPVTPR